MTKLRFFYPVKFKNWEPNSYEDRFFDKEHFYPGTTKYVRHTGTDILLPATEPVFAIADGEIVYVEFNESQYGKAVIIRHQLSDEVDDVIFSVYLHLSHSLKSPVKIYGRKNGETGKLIKRGQLIGFVGYDYENGHGEEHLHFGIYKGEAPQFENGDYRWAFGGYGKLKNELKPNSLNNDDINDIYRTTDSQGGNAIDPVKFLEERIEKKEAICSVSIFKKDFNLIAPGGNTYEWKDAETRFTVPENEKYIIKISASAKNGEQNGSGDDDDLRCEINNHDMRKGQWDGFNIASSFNGAHLKGHTKEIFYFVNLDAIEEDFFLWFDRVREQVIKFFADETPTLNSIEVYPWDEAEKVVLEFFETAKLNDVNRQGIPWKSFIFLSKPKKLIITARCLSAKIKGGTDGDNIKIMINGQPVQNPHVSPDADKYKNYYFSGDLVQGAFEEFVLTKFPDNQACLPKLKCRQDGVELWADCEPFLERVEVEF
jgi:hypothetical protein